MFKGIQAWINWGLPQLSFFALFGNLHARRINIFMAVIRSSLDVIRRSVVFVALISEFFAIFTVLIFTVLIMQTGK